MEFSSKILTFGNILLCTGVTDTAIMKKEPVREDYRIQLYI